MDRRATGRFERGDVGGETRRSREDQQHHVSCRTTLATRSCNRHVAIHCVEQCQLRTFGLRGVRVGEASHPGPTTKRRRMLRSSQRLWDSDAESRSNVRRPTQVDSDSEDEVPFVQVPCVSPRFVRGRRQQPVTAGRGGTCGSLRASARDGRGCCRHVDSWKRGLWSHSSTRTGSRERLLRGVLFSRRGQ